MSWRQSDSPVLPELEASPAPAGVDRRSFMMRSAVVGAAAVLTGCKPAEKEQAAASPAAAPPAPKPTAPLSQDLEVVKALAEAAIKAAVGL